MPIIKKYKRMVAYDFNEEAKGYIAYDALKNLVDVGVIRDEQTKQNNFKQGKMAEIAVAKSLQGKNNFVCELFDKYRGQIEKDPFDIILYNPKEISSERVQELMNEVQAELGESHGIGRKLSIGLRKKIHDAGILTVEVKSTNIKRLMDQNCIAGFGTNEELDILKHELIREQFYFIPLFHQYKEDNITFEEYAKRCNFTQCWGIPESEIEDIKYNVIQREMSNLSDVIVRVFMDMEKNEALIFGGMRKENLLADPEVGTFASNKIAYFKKGLEFGFGIDEFEDIFMDKGKDSAAQLNIFDDLDYNQ